MTIEMLIETRSKLAAEQSFERGIEKGHADIINNLLTSGMSVEQISDICGLDISEVEAVKQQNEAAVLS